MFKSLPDEQKAVLKIVISALSYGFLYYFGSHIMHQNFSPYATMFWRFAIASIALFLLILPRLKKLKISPKDFFSLLFFGGAFHGIAASLYFISANIIGSGLAVVLLFCHPVTVLVANKIFYKTKITAIFYVAISLILIGTFLVSNIGGASFNPRGIIIGIFASIFFGLYIVSSKKSTIEPMLSALTICLGCVITCFTFTIIDGSFIIPNTAFVWSNILGIAIICTALPVALFLNGLKHIPSEKAAIISMLEPISVMVIGFTFLAEKITPTQLLGAFLVILAATIIIISRKPQKKAEAVLETMI